MPNVFSGKVKTFELKDLQERTLFIKTFIAMKEDNMMITTAIDLATGELFVLDISYPETKEEQ